MADLQKLSWINAEVAVQNIGKQKTSQIVAEVAYTLPPYLLDSMEYSSNALAQTAYVSSASANLQSYSEATIKTTGSYALKAVANTSALNATLTKKLFGVDLSGVNSITFDIYSSRTGSNIKVGIKNYNDTITEVTPNITDANTWQEVEIDLSAVADADKNAIWYIIITVVNADSANTFYLDNMVGTTGSSDVSVVADPLLVSLSQLGGHVSGVSVVSDPISLSLSILGDDGFGILVSCNPIILSLSTIGSFTEGVLFGGEPITMSFGVQNANVTAISAYFFGDWRDWKGDCKQWIDGFVEQPNKWGYINNPRWTD